MKNEPKFTAKVHKTVTGIGKDGWDSVFEPHPEGYGFFKTIDETLTGQFKPYYISIYESDDLICIAPCFIADYDLSTTLDEGLLKKTVRIIRKALPRFFIIRIFACGSPLSEGKLGIKPGFNGARLITTLLSEMNDLAKKEGAPFVVFRDFWKAYEEMLDPLTKEGFHKVTSIPSTKLDTSFPSFDDYFSTLSKATKIDLRRKFKRAAAKAKIDVEVRDELGGLLDEAYALYLSNIDASEMTFEIITKDFLSVISKNMPGEVKYILLTIDKKLVGFQQCLIRGGMLSGEYLGLDYKIAYDYHLYFVLMRETINFCIKNRLSCYDAGALSYDPKKRLDFKFIPQYIYVRHSNRAVNFLFGFVIEILKPREG